jgi:hypothetical protein
MRQMDVLNRDFTNTSLSFVLADVDRIVNPLFFDGVNKGNALEATMKGIDRRGGAADLNIWTVRYAHKLQLQCFITPHAV